jgi:hypothetical protein
VVPPPIFLQRRLAASLFLSFLISVSVRHKIKSHGLYIVVFRSNLRRWHEVLSKRSLEGQNHPYHMT